MSKATLEFNIPEENWEHECSIKGVSLALAFSELDQWLRDEQKYQNKIVINIADVRDKLREITNNRDCEFLWK